MEGRIQHIVSNVEEYTPIFLLARARFTLILQYFPFDSWKGNRSSSKGTRNDTHDQIGDPIIGGESSSFAMYISKIKTQCDVQTMGISMAIDGAIYQSKIYLLSPYTFI